MINYSELAQCYWTTTGRDSASLLKSHSRYLNKNPLNPKICSFAQVINAIKYKYSSENSSRISMITKQDQRTIILKKKKIAEISDRARIKARRGASRLQEEDVSLWRLRQSESWGRETRCLESLPGFYHAWILDEELSYWELNEHHDPDAQLVHDSWVPHQVYSPGHPQAPCTRLLTSWILGKMTERPYHSARKDKRF